MVPNQALYQAKLHPELTERQSDTIIVAHPKEPLYGCFYTAYARKQMKAPEKTPEQSNTKKRPFEKIGECLYRYKPNGTYYARIEKQSKEFLRSLRTTDRATAKGKLAGFPHEIGRTRVPRAGAGERIDLGKHLLAEWPDRGSSPEDQTRIHRANLSPVASAP